MVVGRSGLGKSTLINTLFASHMVEPKVPSGQTTEIVNTSSLIEENGVSLKLTITDTPGYGDMVNNDHCWTPVVQYIREQYSGTLASNSNISTAYLRKELTPQRERRIQDTRVHCILFFIAPTGHALTPLDIAVMRKLSENCNVIPVIAKSDSLTMEERLAFKKRIKEEIEYHGIRVYPHALDGEDAADLDPVDRSDRQMVNQIRDMIPFAVVGSEVNVVVDGKSVRGRKTRAGVINVENETHCEFVPLRNFLMRTHLQDMIETTSSIHYENFRTRQLLALKESNSMRPSASSSSHQ
ncbi:MAG: hypothetical protein SGCHY_000024 [Lobulomycetales sp.]